MHHPLQVSQPTIFHDRDFFTFASPLPTVKPRFFSLLRPFDIEVWAMVVATAIITGIVFFFISNIEVTMSSRVQVLKRIHFFLSMFKLLSFRVHLLDLILKSGPISLRPSGTVMAP